MQCIKRAVTTSSRRMKQQKFRFEDGRDAAKYNTKILKQCKYDFEIALQKEKGTMLEPGSEFREPHLLEPIFQHHEHWIKMKKFITEGVTYNLEEVSEEDRRRDLDHMIKRGNHKSAESPIANADALQANYAKEIKNGWMLPVTVESLQKLKGAAVIPVGVASQFSIDENGKQIIKRRTTHDASFPPLSEQSINNRMIRDLLADCFFGHCLLRILHQIHIM